MPHAKAKDGTALFYKDWGSGDPVVLFHGWPLNGDSFDELAMALVAAGRRAIVPDRRGFGRSDCPWDGYDYDTFADDVAAILDDAGIGQPVALVGFSMGGGEVARFLSRQGRSRVSAAVLLGSVVPKVAASDDFPDGVPQETLDGLLDEVRRDRPAFLRSFLQSFYGWGVLARPVSEAVIDASFAHALMASARSTQAAAEAWATTDFRPDLPAFEGVPLLVIHGTADQQVPIDSTARKVAEALPHARLISYDKSPHGLLETDKERLIADVVGFLTEDVRGTLADRSERAIPLN